MIFHPYITLVPYFVFIIVFYTIIVLLLCKLYSIPMKNGYAFKCIPLHAVPTQSHDAILIISYSSTVLEGMSYYELKYIGLYGLCKLFSARVYFEKCLQKNGAYPTTRPYVKEYEFNKGINSYSRYNSPGSNMYGSTPVYR